MAIDWSFQVELPKVWNQGKTYQMKYGEIMWNNILCLIDGVQFSEPVSALVHQPTRLPTSTIRNNQILHAKPTFTVGNWREQPLIEWTGPKQQSLGGDLYGDSPAQNSPILFRGVSKLGDPNHPK